MISGAEIQGGAKAAKSIFDLARGFFSLKSEAEKNAAILSIQREALDLQESYSAALKRVDQLEQEIVRLKNWEAEKQTYELADAGQGTIAYRHKAGMESGEVPHWLCPTCYQKGDKNPLQPETRFPGRNEFLCCQACKTELIISGSRDPGNNRR